MGRKFFLLIAFGMLSACATPYQEMGLLGGVSATRIDEHTVQITAQGNAYTSAATVQNFVMLRAAEETAKDGYDGFQIVGAQDATKTNLVPGYVAVSNGSALYMPPTAMPMPGGIATIRMLKNDDPTWKTQQTFVAEDVIRYLGPSLKKSS